MVVGSSSPDTEVTCSLVVEAPTISGTLIVESSGDIVVSVEGTSICEGVMGSIADVGGTGASVVAGTVVVVSVSIDSIVDTISSGD